MKSPRESFLLSGKAGAWKKIVDTVPELDAACEYALLQLAAEMPHNLHPSLPTDVMVGFDANAQMHGAARVLEILRTISEPVTPPTTPKRESLNYAH
jgi:hypothetical protein